MNQTFVNQTFVNHVVEFRKLFVYIVFTSYCINIYIANLLNVYIHVKTNVYWITSKVFSLKENHCFAETDTFMYKKLINKTLMIMKYVKGNI